jgi:hypothetical protein
VDQKSESIVKKALAMHRLRASVLRRWIVVALASTVFAVLLVWPVSWANAAVTVAALVIAIQTGPRWLTIARYGNCDDANASALRLPRVQVTVRGMMSAVALMAIVLWPVHLWYQRPYYDEMSRDHDLMAYLCSNEATLMKQRAESCKARAGSAAPWDEAGEEAENLRCCPYLSDCPQHGSWSEQAAVWERAAGKAQNAADWHSRMRDYYGGWP